MGKGSGWVFFVDVAVGAQSANLGFWSGMEEKNMKHTCIVLVPGHSQPWSVPQVSRKVVFGRPAVFSIRAIGSMLTKMQDGTGLENIGSVWFI